MKGSTMNTGIKLFLLVTAASTFFISGCSSNPTFSFDITTRRVTILTEPEGAAITQINPVGQPSSSLGVTPIRDRSVMIVSKITKLKNLSYHTTKTLFEQVNNVVVRISKEGYVTQNATLKTDPKETVVHSITLQPIKTKNK
jgi:hypothetical protein